MTIANPPHPDLSDLPRILEKQRMARRITAETTLPGRYAKALMLELFDQKILKPGRSFLKSGYEILDSVHVILNTIESNSRLKSALHQPTIPLSTRLSLLKRIVKFYDTPAIIEEFLYMLMRRKRLDYLEDIYNNLNMMIQHDGRRIPITFVSACKTTSKVIKDMQTWLTDLVNEASIESAHPTSFDVASRIDPSLIAGYRIELPEYVVDASFARQLILIRNAIHG